jgi:hypothetical protein
MAIVQRAAGLGFWAASLPAERAFRNALRSPRESQESILRGYLDRHARTAFGKRYDFASLRSVSDYRRRVPLATYDDLATWIDRASRGETAVLTRDPVTHLAMSSGSTRAAKQVPYTATLQREFRRAVAPWVAGLFRTSPDLAMGPSYWSISPVAREPDRSPAGIPIGFEEDSAYLGHASKRLVDAMMAVPADVRLIQDMEEFRYRTALYLLRCRALRIISVWHPSFLELLLEAIERHWDSLLRDIGGPRSRELSRENPRAYRRIWPRLGMISCWADGHSRVAADRLRHRFPDVTIQPKGLIATEAFVSLPFDGSVPLAVCSHFFEFVDDGGTPHQVHELQEGGEYSVVVTTGGGLYRYRLRDRIVVTEFLHRTPCVRFLGKEDNVSDLCGEKLSEGFVAACQREVFRRHRFVPSFAMLAPDDGGTRYALFIQSEQTLPEDLGTDLDRALGENPHYRYCRDLGQLAPLRVAPIGAEAYRRYVEQCRIAGRRVGDVKPSALDRQAGWGRVLETSGTNGENHGRRRDTPVQKVFTKYD